MSELRRFQNARCNDKNLGYIFSGFTAVVYTAGNRTPVAQSTFYHFIDLARFRRKERKGLEKQRVGAAVVDILATGRLVQKLTEVTACSPFTNQPKYRHLHILINKYTNQPTN